jgi:hypothetical protein
MAEVAKSTSLPKLFGLGQDWLSEWTAVQAALEDEVLKRLASLYEIDTNLPDWFRTLALCLAVEHCKGFHKAVGGGSLSVDFSILMSKAIPRYPKRPGAPTKRFRQAEREDAVLKAALEIRQRSPKLSLSRACALLHQNRFTLPRDKRPLSEKMLYEFAIRARTRQRKALAAALMAKRKPMGFGLLSGILEPRTEKLSEKLGG